MSDAPPPMDDRLRAALGALDEDDRTEPPAPPAELWESIAAAVEEERATDDAPAGPGRSREVLFHPRPGPEAEAEAAPVSPPAAGGTRLKVLVLAAAAIFVVLLGGAVVVRTRQPAVTEVAVLNDDGLPNRSDVRGRAELVDDGGRQVLDVEVPDLPAAAAGQAFEVWLLAGDGGGLQSLGLIEHTGRFTVPAGIDVSRFNIVDVSREPINGDPTHSGDSIVRGTLVPR